MLKSITLEDKKEWIKLNEEFMLYEYEDENEWINPLKFGCLEEDFENIINGATATNSFMILNENEEYIGFITTHIIYSSWAHGKVILVEDFFIKEKERNKKYGEKTIQCLEDYSIKNDIKLILIMAENTNPKAIKFYEKMNYKRQEINFLFKYNLDKCYSKNIVR